ncbi:MAG: hypothetical protein P1U65_03395 [Minwuia sp.]|nr:hypothetical protein [Minwuia sp.]
MNGFNAKGSGVGQDSAAVAKRSVSLDGNAIRKILADQQIDPYVIYDTARCSFADRLFQPVVHEDVDDIRLWLLDRWPDPPRFTSEVFDCDDFAIMFKSFATLFTYYRQARLPLAIGIAWGVFPQINPDLHALNFAITPNNKAVWFEPQDLLQPGARWRTGIIPTRIDRIVC